MALRAELIGPYCLILVTSSVCADSVYCALLSGFVQLAETARMSLLELTAAAHGVLLATVMHRLMGYRSTINSQIRTGTDSGNPTV